MRNVNRYFVVTAVLLVFSLTVLVGCRKSGDAPSAVSDASLPDSLFLAVARSLWGTAKWKLAILGAMAVGGAALYGVNQLGKGSSEEYMRHHGIGVIHGGENSLRFTPHFAITSAEIELMIDVVRAALASRALLAELENRIVPGIAQVGTGSLSG